MRLTEEQQAEVDALSRKLTATVMECNMPTAVVVAQLELCKLSLVLSQAAPILRG